MTTIAHHPDDELLLAHAAATLDAGARLLVACHAEVCSTCRQQVRLFEALGAVLLESEEPARLEPGARGRFWAEVDAQAPRAASAPPAAAWHATLPAGAAWPRSLRGCSATRWRWLAPGIRWSRVTLPADPAANVFALRLAAERSLPPHVHSDRETIQVVYGSFDDGAVRYGCGDFSANREARHQPIGAASDECVCLVALTGRLEFETPLARLAGWLLNRPAPPR